MPATSLFAASKLVIGSFREDGVRPQHQTTVGFQRPSVGVAFFLRVIPFFIHAQKLTSNLFKDKLANRA